MTLTLTPQIEQALDEAARLQGLPPEQVALETLASGLLPFASNGNPLTAEEERKARIRAAKGCLAHLGPSKLMQEKAAEKAREERRWRQSSEGMA